MKKLTTNFLPVIETTVKLIDNVFIVVVICCQLVFIRFRGSCLCPI